MLRKTIIIAEVGECWNGNIEEAKMLIKLSARAGCDYVKFQTLDSETIKDSDPEKCWFEKIALTDQNIGFIINFAIKNGIKPLFTPANLKKARLLKEKFKLSDVKIASSVSHDLETVKYIAKHFKRIFMSTGMNSLGELKNKVNLFNKKVHELYLLHCISEYPTGPLLARDGLKALNEHDVHLNMMIILKKMFPGFKVGYSDHTVGLLASICAVSAGAEVIEKHVTLNRKKPISIYKSGKGYLGTDHVLSIEPAELAELVKLIRQIEKIFGKMKWERTQGENILKEFLVGRF